MIDDRTNFTIGKRVQEASGIGIPYVIVIGKHVSKILYALLIVVFCMHQIL